MQFSLDKLFKQSSFMADGSYVVIGFFPDLLAQAYGWVQAELFVEVANVLFVGAEGLFVPFMAGCLFC